MTPCYELDLHTSIHCTLEEARNLKDEAMNSVNIAYRDEKLAFWLVLCSLNEPKWGRQLTVEDLGRYAFAVSFLDQFKRFRRWFVEHRKEGKYHADVLDENKLEGARKANPSYYRLIDELTNPVADLEHLLKSMADILSSEIEFDEVIRGSVWGLKDGAYQWEFCFLVHLFVQVSVQQLH